MAVDEERELSQAYRTTKRVRRPEGQGLNDLYVRFFRMAERRIAEKTGRGVVCFISNYSWLDGLSFTGMRERYLEVFDLIRIDNLHGDRIISEYAPDGRTSETVFALRGQSPGIKVGTAITLLSKTAGGVVSPDNRVRYRDFHQARAGERREALLDSPGCSRHRFRLFAIGSKSSAWPAIQADGGQPRLVRLAGVAGPVPSIVPGCHHQPRLVLGGYRSRPPQGARRRLFQPWDE